MSSRHRQQRAALPTRVIVAAVTVGLVVAGSVVAIGRLAGSGEDAALVTEAARQTSRTSPTGAPAAAASSADPLYVDDEEVAASDAASAAAKKAKGTAASRSTARPVTPSKPAATSPKAPSLTAGGAVRPPAAAGGPRTTVTVAAAGDIACNPDGSGFNDGQGSKNVCKQQATSDLLVSLKPDAVLALGDNQYEEGTLDAFGRSYDRSWGRVKAVTYPAVGNHEYNTGGAAGYFSYFGAAAGPKGKGYYSYDRGAWHVVVLNSNCDAVSCDAGSPQETWLKADLAAHRNACVLAYWHHPLWSHGEHGDNPSVGAFWSDLYAAGAEIVLNGHDHDYERFAPRRPDGSADTARGVREFVVGTGGRSHYRNGGGSGTDAVNDATFGVLSLTLAPGSYTWRFLPVAGSTWTDSGSGTCH